MIAHLFAQAGNIAPVEEHISALEMLQRGGFLMVVLGVCSVVALGVFIERLFYYKRSRMNVSEFLAGVLALVRRQSYAEAIERCEAFGLKVVGVVAIIDRMEGGGEAFRQRGYPLASLLTIRDFGIEPPACAPPKEQPR